METYEFSRTLRHGGCPGVIVSDNPKATLSPLRAKGGKDVWLFGRASLFRRLLEVGLVHSVEAAIIPVLLGGGVSFLPVPARQAKLKLINHRIYEKTGTVGLEYDVVGK